MNTPVIKIVLAFVWRGCQKQPQPTNNEKTKGLVLIGQPNARCVAGLFYNRFPCQYFLLFTAALLIVANQLHAQVPPVSGETNTTVVVAGGGNTLPLIITQPASQTVENGTDVVLSVGVANDQGLSYQWYRSGGKMVALEGVAGFTSPQLYIVSPSQSDAGSYKCVITGNGGAVTSAVAVLAVRPAIVFSDNFASLDNWQPLIGATALDLDANKNHTGGDGFSAHATNSTQRIFHRLQKLHGAVTLGFWMFDDGSQQPMLAAGTLRAHNSESGYAKFSKPWGLEQSFDIGLHSSTTNGLGGGISNERLDPTKYQGRALRGPKGTNTLGWFDLAITRSPGWHFMQIRRARDGTVTWLVDGVVGKQLRTGVKMADIDTVMLGCWGPEQGVAVGSGQVWFDDVQVSAYAGAPDKELSSINGNPFPTLMQVRETGTNVIADVAPVTVCDVQGANTNWGVGYWEIDGGTITAKSLRGFLQYSVKAPANDVYRIEIVGAEADNRFVAGQPLPMTLNVWCDAEYLGSYKLPYGRASDGALHVFTSYLTNGQHSVSIEWDNAQPERALKIGAVRLQSLPSSILAQNGMKAWVANRLAAQCGLEVAPAQSPVSPVCIEGKDRYLSELTVQADGTVVPVQHGAGYHFYANIPLSSDSPTTVNVSYQSGALQESRTIEWTPTDLLTCTNTLLVRRGDSLLFTALPQGVTNGTVDVTVGDYEFASEIESPVPYTFDQAGTFTVTGQVFDPPASRSITVKVVDASLDPVVPVFGSRASWQITNLPPQIVVQSDPRLEFHRLPANAMNAVFAQTPNARTYRIGNAPAEPMYILARLGKGGPILANAAILGFQFHIPPECALTKIATRDDGSQLVDETVVLSPIGSAAGLSLHCQVLTGGVTFDTGELTRNLTPGDFDNLGICHLKFLRTPTEKNTSICNLIKIYHNGVLVDRK